MVVDGKASHCRSRKDYLYLIELGSPRVRAVLEHEKKVEPIVIDIGDSVHLSVNDKGGIFAVSNNQGVVFVEDPGLEPGLYGLDFRESLMGELVTIKNPRVLGHPSEKPDRIPRATITALVFLTPSATANRRLLFR
ncbi:hypothetical protein F5Y05DRAFT_333681 [Hypoxylon sp. FL0543]|nr:hypothetical protein F5Y05DRAFT_333681 [Hypoxylon sp. FL0543]